MSGRSPRGSCVPIPHHTSSSDAACSEDISCRLIKSKGASWDFVLIVVVLLLRSVSAVETRSSGIRMLLNMTTMVRTMERREERRVSSPLIDVVDFAVSSTNYHAKVPNLKIPFAALN